jgi:hypothetical protein
MTKMTKKIFYWDDLVHRHIFKKSVRCECCGLKKKRMRRFNYPHATNSKFSIFGFNVPINNKYPLANGYYKWRCDYCWKKCPSIGKCRK